MKKDLIDMTIEELNSELRKLRDNLCDLEDMHSFTFNRTSVHIGAETARNLQNEFEQESRLYKDQIAQIQNLLKSKEAR